MNKSITKNYIYNLVYQLTINLIPLLMAPYLARVMGPENLGIFSYVVSISTYFVLAGSLGIALYGKREIAYVQERKKERSRRFYELIFIKIISMSISIGLFYIIFVRGNNEYNLYFMILILELVANMFDIAWFFQGLELFNKIIIRNIIIKCISAISTLIFVKGPEDLGKYLVIYSASIIIANFSLWYKLRIYIEGISIKEISLKRHMIPIVQMFIPQLAIQMYTVLDRTMIGYMIDDKSIVGYYDQSQRLIAMFLTVVTSLSTVMLPRVSNIYAQGDMDLIKNYINKSFKFVFFLSIPMMLGLTTITKYFIPIYLGRNFQESIILINILAAIIVLIGLSNVVGEQYLLPTNRQKEFSLAVFTGAIINFVFNCLLISKYGAIGACISTVFAEISVISVQLYFVRDTFKICKIIKQNHKNIIAGLIMFGVIKIVDYYLLQEFGNLFNCMVLVLLGMMVYTLSLIVTKEDTVIMIINKFKNRRI